MSRHSAASPRLTSFPTRASAKFALRRPSAATNALLTALIVLAGLSLSSPSFSADEAEEKVDPAMRAAVEAFLVVQNTPQIMAEQMTYSVAEQTLGAIAAGGIAITEPMQNLVIEESRKEFGRRFGDLEFLTDMHTPIYAEHFSPKEMLEVVAFWKTPSGQKLMKTAPAVNQAFFARLQEATVPLITPFQARVDARLRAEGMLSAMPDAPSQP
ncbi:MAG: DUF2059 domain-containing protein [Myxococcota bacterium]